jgi:hypothetical protein
MKILRAGYPQISPITQMTHLQKGAFTAERAKNAEIFDDSSLIMLILCGLVKN